jgi:putative nucleotidyltransferase with HDIG domain
MGLVAWFRSLFARLGGASPPAEAPEAPPAPIERRPAKRRAGPALSERLATVDLTEGATYPPEARAPLSDADRERVTRVAAAVRARFDGAAIEAQPFPTRSSRIFALLEDPDFDVEKLVALTQRDPALSASILRVANSAASGSQRKVESLREAIVRLGAETVAGIAAALSTRTVFDTGAKAARGVLRDAWNHTWLHSVSSAFGAGAVAITLRRGDLERCFLGGMLHDIGKTFALRDFNAAWAEVGEADAPTLGVVLAVAEEVHVELGAAVAAAWKLPPFVVEACAQHHAIGKGSDNELAIVILASALADLHLGPHHRGDAEAEARAAAERLGIDAPALRSFRTDVKANVEKARSL